MQVRQLTPTDAFAYRALMLDGYQRHPEAFSSTAAERIMLPMSWWQGRLSAAPDAPSRVFGAFDGPELVGAAGIAFDRRHKVGHKATLFGLYVLPARRGGGLGAQLVQAVLLAARARVGLRVVQLTVTGGNQSALSLYQRCGFQRFGEEPFALALDGRYLSKIHMWFDLAIAADSAAPG